MGPDSDPRQVGRFDHLTTLHQGDDLIVNAEHPCGPRMFRIRNIKQQILGEAAKSV